MDVLQEPVLVLNRNWSCIAMTVARDAIADLVGETVTAVCPESYATYTFEDWVERGVRPGALVLHSPKLAVEVPEVIIRSYYDRIPQRSLNSSKEHIYKRDRDTCMYCGVQPGRAGGRATGANGGLTIDHVLPRSQGGVTSWENCVTACEACNGRKADRTPAQAGMKLLHFPARPRWTMDQAIHRLAQERKPAWQRFVSA
ncbi:MAG TPA: HNH endonuclease [Planctomycetota bacterium]|nr:HNH endonuclease [Planctomycetota bacterium]